MYMLDALDKEISMTFTPLQKKYLLKLCDYAKAELGASTEELSPFYALIYIDWSPLSQKAIDRGKEIGDKYDKRTKNKTA